MAGRLRWLLMAIDGSFIPTHLAGPLGRRVRCRRGRGDEFDPQICIMMEVDDIGVDAGEEQSKLREYGSRWLRQQEGVEQ
jgi:hypothetical protein